MAHNHNLEQPPRLDTTPGTEDLRTLSLYMEEIERYLERSRRQVGAELPFFHRGSTTYNPGSLADGAGVTTTVTVDGAELGQAAFASFSLDLQGITLTAWVSTSDTVSVRFQNESGGVLDLAEGTLRAWSFEPPSHG